MQGNLDITGITCLKVNPLDAGIAFINRARYSFAQLKRKKEHNYAQAWDQ
jgi:hypothetical protein